MNPEPTDANADDDTEGHRPSLHSDAELKHEVTPVEDAIEEIDGDDGDDTQGHRFARHSDAGLKFNITPIGDAATAPAAKPA